ncbi:MAG: deoxyribonuclease IV [Candidatus Marinimicrobia bacterium]|nr:deoxyribonuclease IV [Candidatus Neomarinimicrobiota bacterium]
MALLGAHVSVAGGMANAPGRGRDIDADAIQVFTANQNRWNSPPISQENIDGFRSGMSQGQPRVSVTHDSYLINLCAAEQEKRDRAVNAFIEEMDRSESLGIPYIVFHPGAHMGAGVEAGCRMVAESLDTALHARPDYQVKLLVEITAGQGTTVGHAFEQIAMILGQVKEPDRMGVCFDTQHAFAAGYDLRTVDVWEETMTAFDSIIGLDQLKVFHLNDSKRELNSRVDRHESLGEGFLGLAPFWCLVNDERFTETPAILETPVDDGSEYAEEIMLLRSLIGAPEPEPVD